ncbi:MAG: hypothetical protein QOJ58_879 [Alphaproteobacteria bacterium]|nr:hypothetical protein [Alphaproteobacteria bacterium]
MRRLLFDAAHVMLTRTIRWSWLKAWGMKIARHREGNAQSSPWRGEWR